MLASPSFDDAAAACLRGRSQLKQPFVPGLDDRDEILVLDSEQPSRVRNPPATLL